MKLRTLGDRVILKHQEAEEKTQAGTVLPDSTKEKRQEAVVATVGSGESEARDGAQLRALSPVSRTSAFASIAALKMGRSSASLICDSDIFSSVGMGTNSSVSKAIERNLSNAARHLGNFLLDIRFISSTFCPQINPWLG